MTKAGPGRYSSFYFVLLNINYVVTYWRSPDSSGSHKYLLYGNYYNNYYYKLGIMLQATHYMAIYFQKLLHFIVAATIFVKSQKGYLWMQSAAIVRSDQ